MSAQPLLRRGYGGAQRFAAPAAGLRRRFIQMLKKITYIAKKNHRSLNAQLEHLTQECIDAYEQQHGKINTEE